MREAGKPEVVTKTEVRRNSSRTVMMFVAALLIVIAIAGIVLSGRKAIDNASGPAAPASAAVAMPGASTTPDPASAPTAAAANEVNFVAGSDKMPAGASDIIARFVEKARSENKAVRISARYLTGANKAQNLEMAKARTGAVRHAVVADGMTGDRVTTELVEVAAGSLSDRDANRIELLTR